MSEPARQRDQPRDRPADRDSCRRPTTRRAQDDGAARPAPGDDPGPAASTRSRRSRDRSTSSTRPTCALNQAGVVVRARRIQGGRGDTVVKLRPVGPRRAPRGAPQVGGLQRRGRRAARRVRVLGVVQGALHRRRGPRGRDRRHGAAAPVLQDAARVLPGARAGGRLAGRSDAARADVPPQVTASTSSSGPGSGPPQSLVAEVWFYPDGSRILELSTKCLPEEAFKVAAETRAYLARAGRATSAASSRRRRRRRSSSTQPVSCRSDGSASGGGSAHGS